MANQIHFRLPESKRLMSLAGSVGSSGKKPQLGWILHLTQNRNRHIGNAPKIEIIGQTQFTLDGERGCEMNRIRSLRFMLCSHARRLAQDVCRDWNQLDFLRMEDFFVISK